MSQLAFFAAQIAKRCVIIHNVLRKKAGKHDNGESSVGAQIWRFAAAFGSFRLAAPGLPGLIICPPHELQSLTHLAKP